MSKAMIHTCNNCKKKTEYLDGWLAIEAIGDRLAVENNLPGHKIIKMGDHESMHFCSRLCFVSFFVNSDLEDELETAYWHFDAARKGDGEYKGRPQIERDAFKSVIRGVVSRV